MGRLKLSALVGAAILLLPIAARAADYPQPPPYIPPPVEIGKQWYLKGYIGMAAQHFDRLSHPLFDDPQYAPASFQWLDTGEFGGVPLAGIGVGFRHSDHLRFDLTAEYRSKSPFSALDRYDSENPDSDFGEGCTFGPEGNCGTNHYTGKKDEWLFLANAYYDFSPIHGITPYVGAGVGASYNTIYDFVDDNVPTGGQGWAPTGHKWSLAWALHAGASVQLNDRLTLDLGYSFTKLGDAQTGLFQNVDTSLACTGTGGTCYPMTFKGIYSHDVKLSLRWAFDHGQTYYPPVVAKY